MKTSAPETQVSFRAPLLLVLAAEREARCEKISLSAFIRRALVEKLYGTAVGGRNTN